MSQPDELLIFNSFFQDGLFNDSFWIEKAFGFRVLKKSLKKLDFGGSGSQFFLGLLLNF